MGTYTRSHSFTAGEKPTEAQWNVDIDGLITLCNGQIDKANVDSSSTDGIVTMDEAQTVTGRKAFSGNIAAELTIDTVANAAGSVQDVLTLEWDPGDGANLTDNSSGISLLYKMPDDADNQDDFAALTCMVVSDATGSEEGEFSFRLVKAGTLTEIATLAPTTGLTVGVDGTGYDVKFFGDTAGSHLLWDESADSLLLTDSTPLKIGDSQDLTLYHDGSNSYITNAVGALKIATETSGIAVTIGHTTSEVTVADNLTVTGTLTLGSGAELTEAELEFLDGITAGTVAASKAVVVDSNLDAASFRNVTLTGELDAATLDISGNADIDGTTNLDAVDIDGAVQIDATVSVGVDDQGYDVKFFGDTASAYLLWDTSADKLLTAGGASVDIVKDKLLIGGTAVTTTAAELNVLDAVTAGTVSASLGVVVDSNKDIGSFRNITLTGELDAGSLDVSGDADIDGTLEADAITVDGTALNEYIADTAGAMFTSNTETGITATYQDADNTIDLAIAAAQTTITSLLATDIKIGEDDQTKIDFETANQINLYSNNSVAMEIDSSQNTILKPGDGGGLKFYAGGTGHGNYIRWSDDSGSNNQGSIGYDHSSNAMLFSTSATERMRIDSAGKVGFGVTDPDTQWEFSGTNDGGDIGLTLTNAAGSGSSDETVSIYFSHVNQSVDAGKISSIRENVYNSGAASDSAMAFYTSLNGTNTEAMRINSGQQVLIGATAIADPYGAVQIAHSSSGGNAHADADELFIESSGNTGITIASSTSGTGNLLFGDSGDNDIGRIQYHHSSNQLGIVANATGTTFFNSGPMVAIGDGDANGNMTAGLTINQGTATNHIFALKSDTIVHTMTDLAETDTYLGIKKSDVAGGALFEGYEGKLGTTNGQGAITFVTNHYASLNSTKSAGGGHGSFRIKATTRSNQSHTAPNADANLLSVESYTNVRFIVDQEGDVHYDGTTNASAWDDHDDVALLDSFRALTAPDTPDMRQVFGDVVQEHAQVLNDTGVITLNDDGHHFVSTKGLNGLLIDSIRQVHSRAEERDQKLLKAIDQRDTKIALLEQRLNRLEN